MADKLPFKLIIKLEGYRPEAVHAALQHLDTLCSEYDHAPELKATATIESNDEAALTAIRAQLEMYLRSNKTLVEGKVTMEAPLIRPKHDQEPLPMEPYFSDIVHGDNRITAVEFRVGDKVARIGPDTVIPDDDDDVLEIRGR